MKTDLYKSVKEAFDRNGVEIPFPYRTLVFKNPEDQDKT
jgi:small-conductance mechanosensitive channel